jgi:hypothetical protein
MKTRDRPGVHSGVARSGWRDRGFEHWNKEEPIVHEPERHRNGTDESGGWRPAVSRSSTSQLHVELAARRTCWGLSEDRPIFRTIDEVRLDDDK